MSFHKVPRLCLAFACGANLIARAGLAQDFPGSVSSSPLPLQASIVNEPVPNLPPVPLVCVSAGTNRFSFLMPDGFRLSDPEPGKLVLVNVDYSCFLTFRIVGAVPADSKELRSDSCRELVLKRYSGAKILEEFSLTAANHSGPAFDVQWKNPGGGAQSARIACIPSAAGILAFSLEATSDKFPAISSSFNSLLLTFRTNERGKLENVHLSDKI